MKQKIIFFITIFIIFYGNIIFAQDSASLNPDFSSILYSASDSEIGKVPANEWTTIKGEWLHQPKITVFFKEGLVSYNQDDMYWFNHYLKVDLPNSNIKVVSSNGGLKKYAIKPNAMLVAGDLEHSDYGVNLDPPIENKKKTGGDRKGKRFCFDKSVHVEGNPMYLGIHLEDYSNYGGRSEMWLTNPEGQWERFFCTRGGEHSLHHDLYKILDVKKYRDFWVRFCLVFGSHHTRNMWVKLHEYDVDFDVIKIYDNFTINYVAIDQQ